MSDQDKYTRNLVVKPKRKPVQIDPETEEAFEESKDLVKESVHKAAKTNMAFVTWLAIFTVRLVKHGAVSILARIFRNKSGGTQSRPVNHAKPNGRRKTRQQPPRKDA
ncbi:hypothetical protein [Desulfoplanes sp.]